MNDLSFCNLPPQNIECEEAILASCFIGNAEDVAEFLKPEHFYRSAHQKIFSSILDLIHKSIEIELPSVFIDLKEKQLAEKVGGAAYLSRLIDHTPIAINIQHYCQVIKDKAALRKIIEVSNTVTKQCFDDTIPAADVIDNAQSGMLGITTGSGSKTYSSFKDISLSSVEQYEKTSKEKKHITGIASGYHWLDSLLCGFQPSDLIIIAARPSMGKTALSFNMLCNMAKSGTPGLFFSLEMSKEQLFNRQMSRVSGINLQKFRTCKFDTDDWSKITEGVSAIYDYPVFIDDTPALHYNEIRTRTRKLIKDEGVKIIFIDHLQLVKGEKERTRDREIGTITAGLKAAAKELKIPVILLSQLNRQLDQRSNPYKRPKISDLRDSGNIEQDADVIMFLYRPGEYDDDEKYPGQTELNIAKQRNGPTGQIELLWKKKVTTFYNLESGSQKDEK